MRYPKYEPQVNAILDVARASMALQKHFEDACPGNFIQHLDEHAVNWWWSLIDIVMDYEQRADRFAVLIRTYRRRFPRRARETSPTSQRS